MTPISIAPTSNRPGRATTLIEILVVSAIMMMIIIGVYMILHKGMQFYRLNASINDRQRSVLFMLSRLNGELQDGNSDLIFVDPPVVGGADPEVHTPSKGLSYGIALNEAGQAEFDADQRLYWQANGCFFLRPDGDFRWVRVNYPGGRTIAPLTPDLSGITPQSLAGTTSGKLIAREITALTINVRRTNEAGQTLDKPVYEFIVECGRKGDSNGYWLELRSSVYPRN